jgi:hypothetical protein
MGTQLPELDQKFKQIDRSQIRPEAVPGLVERYGQAFLVFLDRSDSEHWPARRRRRISCSRSSLPGKLVLDRQASSTDRLRIWRLGRAVPSETLPQAQAREKPMAWRTPPPLVASGG